MVFPSDYENRILCGDALTVLRAIPDDVVQCVVTSPPYWGLRDYGTSTWEGGDPECDHQPPDDAGHTNKPTSGQRRHAGRFAGPTCYKCGAVRIDKQIGLESTPEQYIEKMVEIFSEVRRVLRPDGTLWLNMGDSYASGKGSCFNPGGGEGSFKDNRKEAGVLPLKRLNISDLHSVGLKPKDLCGMPWRVALALQADGWWLRSDIIWAKSTPMPESAKDRPTKAHEYIFLMTKSERYYYDGVAIREPLSASTLERFGKNDVTYPGRDSYFERRDKGKHVGQLGESGLTADGQRNARTVWTIAAQSYPGAHFATFPEELPRRCIRAGTPKKGCCAECGKPWVRMVEVRQEVLGGAMGVSHAPNHDNWQGMKRKRKHVKTIGWEPSCQCESLEGPVPAIVMDPFAGTGTTIAVAIKEHRRGFGIELSSEYITLAEKRIAEAKEIASQQELKL
jgi:DNA modification methylase